MQYIKSKQNRAKSKVPIWIGNPENKPRDFMENTRLHQKLFEAISWFKRIHNEIKFIHSTA